jgi:Transposase DDE domain
VSRRDSQWGLGVRVKGIELIRGHGMADVWKQGTGLGDSRLDDRAALMFEQMVATHSVVLKKLGGKRAGELGAGRLLASGKVDAEGLLAPFFARTAEAVRGRRIVAVQDTTEINFAGRDKRRRGLGAAGDGVSKGFFIHPVIAIDADDGAVVGVAAAEFWTRSDDPVADRHLRAFADKESARWLRGAQLAAARLDAAASVIVVGDRESDIYEVFEERPTSVDLLVRARHDRKLSNGVKLFDATAAFPELGGALVKIASKGIGDKGRIARVLIKAGAVEFARPQRATTAVGVPALRVIEVVEVDAPRGVEPLLWRLVTTLPVATLGDACEIVRLYRLRWRIEETFRTLKKDGLRLEETQVADASAIMKLAALALAAAVRIVQVVDARDGSSRPATDCIDARDVEAVDAISRSLEGATVRQQNPWPKGALPWLSWVVARLGSWNCYGKKPGPKTMADGWHRLSHMLDGFHLATHNQDV